MRNRKGQPPKAVLWDWDNTLVDSWGNIFQALSKTFSHMGKTPWTLEETKNRVHQSLENSFPPLFGDRWREAGDYYRQIFGEIHLDGLAVMQGAEETLCLLRDAGVYGAVISNKRGDTLRKESSHLNWNGYFSILVGALDTLCAKPAPDPALLALKDSGIAAGDEVWLIGDSLSDMRCAHATGCVPILFGDDAYIDTEALETCPPAFRVRDHAALRALLGEFSVHPSGCPDVG